MVIKAGSGTGVTGLSWLLGDHLGSTSIMTDGASEAKLSKLHYKPWGEKSPAGSSTLPLYGSTIRERRVVLPALSKNTLLSSIHTVEPVKLNRLIFRAGIQSTELRNSEASK